MAEEKERPPGRDSETDLYMQRLIDTDPLAEIVLPRVIDALALGKGSRGLDAGCGIGLQARLLADAVGPDGHVAGVDLSADFVGHAQQLARESGMSERLSFRQGDVHHLPFEDRTFDWAWSANCVGYAPLEPLPLVKELARVVKPGGRVALLIWSSQTLLPGYPRLEARLSATSPGIAPFSHGTRPERHFLRALGWFQEAGLEDSKARAFVGSMHAPLGPDIRTALVALFEMRWPGAESELTEKDAAEYRRLCRPGSPDFILDQPDYYAFFVYSLFWGRVPG